MTNQVVSAEQIDGFTQTLESSIKQSLPTYYDKWVGVSKKTDRIDLDESMRAIDNLYKECGETPPLKYVFCSSPLALAIIYQYYEAVFQTDPDDIECIPMEDFRNIPIENLVNFLHMYLQNQDSWEGKAKVRPANWEKIVEENANKKAFSKSVILNSQLLELSGPTWSHLCDKESHTKSPLVDSKDRKNEGLKLELNEVFSKISHYGYHQSHQGFIIDVSNNQIISPLHDFIEKNPELSSVEKFQDLSKLLNTIQERYEFKKTDGILKLIDSCGYCIFNENIVFVCDRYEQVFLKKIENNATTDDLLIERLHNPDGPAVRYTDGFAGYAIDGIYFDKHVIMNPEKITAKEILDEKNAEKRRILITRMGHERFVNEAACKLIDSEIDMHGNLNELYVATFERKDDEDSSYEPDEPLAILKVTNSTKEKDGSAKIYHIEVPAKEHLDPKILEDGSPAQNPLKGDMLRVRQAKAWSMDEKEEEYDPQIET